MRPRTVVQFMHPGPEHVPDRLTSPSAGWKEWNRGMHRRKFLAAPGTWTPSPARSPSAGTIAFWGEWEPQSACAALPENNGFGFPRWLHRPRLDLDALSAAPGASWQNTDPLVFGNMFRYAICRQFRPTSQKRTLLSFLTAGDVLLFGSHVGGEFVLDTVVVVKMFADVVQNGPAPDWQSALHLQVTMNLVELPPDGVRLFGGATWSSDAPFSFVPCVTWSATSSPFARPNLRPYGALQSVITPALKMGFKTTSFDDDAQVRQVWDEVVDQILGQGCLLGTHVDEPSG